MIETLKELPRTADIVIIGGGVTGLSAGWWLARDGLKVVVLDKGIVGWQASGRNGGGASHYQSPLFDEEQRLWPMMDELLGYPTEYRRERIIIATTDHHLEHYRYMARMCRELGYEVDELDAQQALEAVPIADASTCLGGIHLRFGGHANPQRSVQAYAWALQDLGGTIAQHTPVTGFRQAGGRITAVETARGIIEAGQVVIAAGPQTGMLAALVGLDVPLAPSRAEMIVTEPAPLMTIGGVDGNGLYGRQTLRGNLAFGGGPHEWTDTDMAGPQALPTTPLSRNLARRVAELFPRARHLRVIRSWAGMIENTPDGRPVLERMAAPDNLTLATMSAVGFGLSPASGRAIRDLVVEGRCTFTDLEKLRLSRFADLPPDWRVRQGWLSDADPATRPEPVRAGLAR